MRWLLAPLLVLLPVLAGAQVTWNKEMPPTHPALPGPKSFAWDLDGTHEVDFTWEYGPAQPLSGYYPDVCENKCRGKKHFLHEQCDTSCDDTCRELHRETLRPYVMLTQSEFLENPNRFDHVFERELRKVGVGNKYPADQVAWGMVAQARDPLEKDPKYQVEVRWNHFVKAPCESALRCHVAYGYDLTLVWEVFRYDVAPDGRRVKVSGGKHRTLLGQVSIPQDGVAEEHHTPRCHCSIVKEEEPEEPEPPLTVPIPPVEEKRTGAVIQENSSGTAVCDSQTLDRFGFKVVCENMNECTVSCSNPTSEQQTFIVLPGTFLLSLDPAYQDMCCTTPIRLVVPPMSSASETVSIAHGPYEPRWEVSGKGRLLCMDMHLREPRADVGYRIAGSAGPAIGALAKYTYASSIRGTHDQVRMWIATDGASFDEIAGVLFPKPREGMYADSLFQAFQLARLKGEDPKFAGCFDPKILAGAAKPQTTDWLVGELTRRGPDKLVAWVSSNPQAFAGLFTESGARLGVPHAARLAAAMGRSADARVRKASTDLLLRAVPEASRAAVAEAGGLAGVGSMLMSGQPEDAKAAMDVLEAYRSPLSAVYLRNVGTALPDDIKSRASDLLKALSAGTRVATLSTKG